MLGWFKKKFGRKKAKPEVTETEIQSPPEQEAVDDSAALIDQQADLHAEEAPELGDDLAAAAADATAVTETDETEEIVSPAVDAGTQEREDVEVESAVAMGIDEAVEEESVIPVPEAAESTEVAEVAEVVSEEGSKLEDVAASVMEDEADSIAVDVDADGESDEAITEDSPVPSDDAAAIAEIVPDEGVAADDMAAPVEDVDAAVFEVEDESVVVSEPSDAVPTDDSTSLTVEVGETAEVDPGESVDGEELGAAVEDADTEVSEVEDEAVTVKREVGEDDISTPVIDETTVLEAGLGEGGEPGVESPPADEPGVADAVTQTEGVASVVEGAAVDEPEISGQERSDQTKEAQQPASKSLFQRLQNRLGKTRDSFVYRLDTLFLGKRVIDQALFDDLEEILITADLGVATTMELLDDARKKVKRNELSDPQALKGILRDRILGYLVDSDQPAELVMPEEGPFVIMVVGVNGVGKTTSIGKIAAKFVAAGQSVLLIAGDTFRAAAIDQLKIWGERVGVKVIAHKPGDDPSSVVFDGLEYGAAHEYDVILIDTAGRLHTSVNLMEELKKIKRVIGKKLEGAPHEVMLVLDATTGQNGISQAKLFHEAVGISGLTLTKLDGTAKGGIVANVCREMLIPVRFIGIGEQIDDLRDFDPEEFVDALFAPGEPQ